METRAIRIQEKVVYLKFGLKGLIELSKFSNPNAEEILYCGLITLQPDIQLEDVASLAQNPAIQEAIEEIFNPDQIPDTTTIEEWYKRGIGEIGLPLSTFYCLTPYELDLAYEGYLRRVELQANLTKLSFLQAQARNSDPIVVEKGRGYSLGSLKEREAMFSQLGIQK